MREWELRSSHESRQKTRRRTVVEPNAEVVDSCSATRENGQERAVAASSEMPLTTSCLHCCADGIVV